MSEPVIKPAFQSEIARVQRNERVLQQVYEARLHAGDANRAVDTAKIALADAVIAAGGGYTRDDLVRAVLAGIAHGAGEGIAFVETNPGDIAEANAIVDRLTKGDV